MNTELKALLMVVFDGLALGKDVGAKNYFAIMGDVGKLVTDGPAAIANIALLQSEIAALPGSAQQADLIAFINQQFSVQIPSQKAHLILMASIKVIQDAASCVLDSISLTKTINS